MAQNNNSLRIPTIFHNLPYELSLKLLSEAIPNFDIKILNSIERLSMYCVRFVPISPMYITLQQQIEEIMYCMLQEDREQKYIYEGRYTLSAISADLSTALRILSFLDLLYEDPDGIWILKKKGETQ